MTTTRSGCFPPSAVGDMSSEGAGTTLPSPRMGADIKLTMPAGSIGEFFPILLQGFGVAARLPCTVKTLLCDQLGLGPDYVEKRITTIFLNGKPTDTIDEASVGAGATIALSAAMPGLVGATMRRDGYYAAMRSGITYRESLADVADRAATVRIKLFNLLLPELGPEFLRRGVLLDGPVAGDFFGSRGEDFRRGGVSVLLDGAPIEPVRLVDGVRFDEESVVRLTVIFRDGE